MKFNIRYWIHFSLFNLSVVALLGVLMRYKIGFEFPYFDQKHIQYAHSHFAFAGWIAQTIYVLLIHFLSDKIPDFQFTRYKSLLIANLVCSYGMLISFAIQGYGAVSIVFSTGTIVIACFFAACFFNDSKYVEKNNISLVWIKAALWFNIFSSIGTLYLAFIMATHQFNENWYLAAVYFYLHFQYNGFFMFSCMGLALSQTNQFLPNFKYNAAIFQLFFASVIPAYFLSTLWAKLPVWLYVIVVVAAFVQVIAWFIFLKDIRKALPSKLGSTPLANYLFLFVAIALSIKLLLQLGSTIPVVSKLAFGFRPVVIAYLHLVLLAVVSVFLLTYLFVTQFIHHNRLTTVALCVFVIGVFLNQLVLGTQGVASFSYISIPYVNETLFCISLILVFGALMIVISQRKNSEDTGDPLLKK